ncbi:MAG: hypothetical protein C4547_05385 [Phycisphaerales bacterium]|nr:MAG: hypothetical protein C4547_05385 [Phycisphaerales bacterium]
MIYATTLMTSLAVIGAGITLVTLQTSDRQLRANLLDVQKAHWTAHAGLEWVLMYADQNDNWRTGLDGVSSTFDPRGEGGVVTVSVTDGDGNLGNDDRDTAFIQAAAILDDLNYTIEIAAQSRAHQSFAYGLFATSSIYLCNSRIDAAIYAGTRVWDLCSAVTTTSQTVVNGPSGTSVSASIFSFASAVDPIAPPNPDPNFYLGRATVITPTSNSEDTAYLTDVVLSTTRNSRGAVNGEGVYLIDAGASVLELHHVALRGTLIITGNGGNRIRFRGPVRATPGRPEYPTLVILVPNTHIDFEMPGTLVESTRGVDFNEDGDTSDTLTQAITGVVYAPGADVDLENTPWTFDGVMIADVIEVKAGVTVTHDDRYTDQLMPGFTDKKLYPVPGTAKVIMP